MPGYRPRSQAACLPITALQRVAVGTYTFLLAGSGPCVEVFDSNGALLLRTQIFESQVVHGLQSISVSDELDRVDVVVWGGCFLRCGQLSLRSEPTVAAVNPLFQFRPFYRCVDWILKAVVTTDSTLSGKYSVVILTAHNVLQQIQVDVKSQDEPFKITRSVQGLGAFLYSGDLHAIGGNSIIIASGTVFGELLVWTCQTATADAQWDVITRYTFTGHLGSVFGVAISPLFNSSGTRSRLLASCSDDRTIRIWDISDCDLQGAKATYPVTSAETGFGGVIQNERSQLTSAWGHLSRIWGVEFLNSEHVKILSRGEDGACQVWSLNTSGNCEDKSNRDTTLTSVTHDRHHHGKNAWSICQFATSNQVMVYTGGADGRIISRSIDSQGSQIGVTTCALVFRDLVGPREFFKQYLLLSPAECLASTDNGNIYRLTLAENAVGWEKVYTDAGKSAPLLCLRRPLTQPLRESLALIAHQDGKMHSLCDSSMLVPLELSLGPGVSWIQFATQSSHSNVEMACVISVVKKAPTAIWCTLAGNQCEMWQKTNFKFPDTFTITSAAYSELHGVLALGSRAGALAVYFGFRPGSEHTEPICLRHVHESDCVTSISFLNTSSKVDDRDDPICLLTTGRDGTYAIHHVTRPTATGLGGDYPRIVTVHISHPPFGPCIEGAYFIPSKTNPRSRELILYGFRSTQFVVWNETQQSMIMSIECGGTHRSWSFIDAEATSLHVEGDASAVGTETPDLATAKSFVWNQGGRFHWHSTSATDHTIIKAGSHGREIKAVARSPLPFTSSHLGLNSVPLIATGAEDTNIHLFAVTSTNATRKFPSDVSQVNPSQNDFKHLATLKRHTTGVQQVCFSPCGRYLFSAGGVEEFYVWKLSFGVSVVGLGAMCMDVLPKTNIDADARIMGLDVQLSEHDGEGMVMIVLAYSNGKAKVLTYTEGEERMKGRLEVLRVLEYGTFCLTQAAFLSSFSPTTTHVLTAGTNGILNLTPDILTVPGFRMDVHRTHQSAVLAMATVPLDKDRTSWLVATGGDDNALCLTLLLCASPSASVHQKQPFQLTFRTVCIPKAHAAALTALQIIRVKPDSASNLLVVTVGNDQRVQIWELQIGQSWADAGDVNLKQLQVRKAGGAWTSVADVSGLEIIPMDEHSDRCDVAGLGLLVVGVGMEILRIEVDGDEK